MARVRVAALREAVSRQLFEDAVIGIGLELFAARGWTVHSASFPVLDVEFAAPERHRIRAHAASASLLWFGCRTAIGICRPDQIAAQDHFRLPRESIAALFDVLRD